MKYDRGVEYSLLKLNAITYVWHQPWQMGLFHEDLKGKFLWYPKSGTLVFESEDGAFSRVRQKGDFEGRAHKTLDVIKEVLLVVNAQKGRSFVPAQTETMSIYCTGCHDDVEARLTDGREMYPHRDDLAKIPFWVCDTCRAFVGTHHKTKHWKQPLGYLATPAVKQWRMKIHQTLDPLWQNGIIERGKLYKRISKALGHDYHAGNIYDEEEGQFIYEMAQRIKTELDPSPWNR